MNSLVEKFESPKAKNVLDQELEEIFPDQKEEMKKPAFTKPPKSPDKKKIKMVKLKDQDREREQAAR